MEATRMSDTARQYDDLMKRQKWSPMRAGFWDRVGDTPPKTAVRLLLRHHSNRARLKIIDVGCGDGHDLVLMRELLTELGYRGDLDLVGLDISAEMVKACRQKSLNVIQDDFCSMSLAPLSGAHLVWSNMGLIHVPLADFPTAVERMVSVAADNGIVCVSFKTGNDSDKIDPPDERIPVPRYTAFHSVPTVASLMEKNRCAIVSTIDIPSETDPSYSYCWLFGQKKS